MTQPRSLRISAVLSRAIARRWEVARWGRLIAGLSTLAFTLLGVCVDRAWLLGTLGVALQLVVTALTDRCPLRNLLMRLGLREREDLFVPGGARRMHVAEESKNAS